MKKLICILLLISMIFTVSCGQKSLEKEEITIFHATDMHYLSQQLTENSPAFVEMIQNGDGKMVHYIDSIIDAFVADVIAAGPDYLVISGDMTFNGEKLSHVDLAHKLETIEKNGVQVLALPGNHDIDYPFCYGYGQTQYYPAERMKDEDYENLYADFGLKQAYTRNKASFSYMCRLTDKITLIALDTNRGGGTGIVAPETLVWLEEQLSKSSEDTVFISVTHQNLLSHFGEESFTNSYTIINNQPVIELYEKYGVKFNLSGHIHTQHIYSEGNITDIATESMAVLPCNYGVIDIDPDSIDYTTQSVNVQQWATENQKTYENLLNFNDYARDFYIKSQSALSMHTLAETRISEQDRQLMSDFFAELNIYYFPGTIDKYYDYLVRTEGYKKWLEKGGDLWHYQYVMARMEEGHNGIPHNSRTIAIN